MLARIVLAFAVLAAVLPAAGGSTAPPQSGYPIGDNVAVVPNWLDYGKMIVPAHFPPYHFTQLDPTNVSSVADLDPHDTVILW